MSNQNSSRSPHQERLNRIVAEYLQAADRGRPLERQQVLAQNPDLAGQLEQFFADHDRMNELADPIRAAEAAADASDDAFEVAASEPAGSAATDTDAPTLPPTMASQPADASALPPTQASGREPAEGAEADAEIVPPPGTKVRYFGDYELLEEIARGGMGVVHKARQVSLNRIVALKMILTGQLAGEDDVKRFHAEAEAAANLDHPGIVPIFEVGCHAGQHYFSMGYVEGQSLAEPLRDGPLAPRQAAELVRQVAEAVQYAHDHGVIHRDLKPANVLLHKDEGGRMKDEGGRMKDEGGRRKDEGGRMKNEGGRMKNEGQSSAKSSSSFIPHPSSLQHPSSFQPRITDFGLAKQVEADSNLTASGQVLGTPSFMPPEQASGKLDQVGPQSDVYALGAILYACLTGRPPFQAASPVDTLMQVMDQEPAAPRQLNHGVPRDLDTICLKCLEKEPRRRYASAQALADDLGRYLQGEPIDARPPGPIGRVNRWARRRPALAITIAALTLFYTNHLIDLYVLQTPGAGGTFHWFATGLVFVWLFGAVTFQYLARRFRTSSLAIYGWAGMDVLLLTAFLSVANGPKSTVLVGYLLLVAGAALRFRIGLVWFVTTLSLTGYLWLVVDAYWYRPQYVPKPGAILPFELGLGIMGLMMHFILRRARPLESTEAAAGMPRDDTTRQPPGGRFPFR